MKHTDKYTSTDKDRGTKAIKADLHRETLRI